MSFIDNPFRNRKPVADPSLFCGRHDVLALIAENIRQWQMCVIAGEIFIGKTSLLYYLVHPQGAWSTTEFREYLDDPDCYLRVLIELGRLPIRNASGFFRYLFDRIVEEASKLPTSIAGRKNDPPLLTKPDDDYETQKHLEQYVKLIEGRVLLLFDDFDIVVNAMCDDDIVKIMQKMRSLTQAFDLQDKLNCIFVSADPLKLLCKPKGSTSIIDSIFSRIVPDYKFLRPLADEEIEQFITRPFQLVEQRNIFFTPEEIDFIKQIAGHHPVMIKTACFHLFEAKTKKDGSFALFQIREVLEKDPNIHWLMDFQWQRLVDFEQQAGLSLTECLAAIARGRSPKEPATLETLHNEGLIDNSASEPWIWGDTFRRFILRKHAEARHNAAISSVSTHGRPSHIGYKIKAPLAPLEEKLFNYLAHNLERTCERTELHKVLWGDKPPRSRDALEQLIKRLREKIEPRPEFPEYLLTVRGQGYLLRESSNA